MKRPKTVPPDLNWDLVLRNLEGLAAGWDEMAREADQQGTAWADRQDPETAHWYVGRSQALAAASEDLRTVLIAYLRPGLRVRYLYATQWRTGMLLVPPSGNNPCWQIKRDEAGAMIDQVAPAAETIRVYVETGDPV